MRRLLQIALEDGLQACANPSRCHTSAKIAQLGLDQNIDTSLAAGELILHITGAYSGAVCLPIRLSWRSEELGQRHVIAQIPNDVLIDSITPTPGQRVRGTISR